MPLHRCPGKECILKLFNFKHQGSSLGKALFFVILNNAWESLWKNMVGKELA